MRNDSTSISPSELSPFTFRPSPKKMKTQILAIGRHPEILQTVVRLVNNNPDWECTGASTDDEAILAFSAQSYKLVLLGGGIEQESEDRLCAAFRALNPEIVIVQHYGGGSGLLTAEIYQALGR
jgi:PleD family two-component response regulator